MRRGQTDMLMDVISYVLFTVIVIVFFIIFHLIKGCNNPSVEKIISEAEMKRDVDMVLVNVLRSPVQKGQMTDLIWLFYQDDGYEDELDEQIKAVMGRIKSDYSCWKIEIMDKSVIYSLDNGCANQGRSRQADIKMALPMNPGSLAVDVRLTQYEQEDVLYGMG